MLSFDKPNGKCCISGSGDGCLNDQFYCSNKVSTSFNYHKYTFCSFNSTICGANQRNLKSRNTQQSVITGLEFTQNDVCPYIITSDTNLPFNTQVRISVDSLLNANFYILQGSSIDTITSQTKLTSGGSVTLDTSQIAYIIIQGTYTNPVAQFSYQNVQIISDAGWMGIIIGSSFGFFLILFALIILITRKLTLKRLREMQSPNIVYFLKKKVIQYMSMPRTKDLPTPKADYLQVPQIGLKEYFNKMNKEEKLNQLEFPHEVDHNARQNTDVDRLMSARTGITQLPPTQPTTAPQGPNDGYQKPKLSFSYTITSACYACLASTVTPNKYCVSHEDATTGYCCDTSNTADFCSESGKYLCSDAVKSTSMKLYLCPTTTAKCFQTSTTIDFDQNTYSKVLYVGDQGQQVGGTTLEFGQNDICSWRLIADSQYTSNKYIRVTIDSIYQTNCFINSGSGIKSTSNEVTCVTGTQYDFDADQNVFIVVQGSVAGASMYFTYQLVDRISFQQIAIIYSVSVGVFVILASLLVLLTIRFVVQLTIRKSQNSWQAMAVEMKHIVENANKKVEHSKIGSVEDLDNYNANTNAPESRLGIRDIYKPTVGFGQVKPWNDPIQDGFKNPQAQFNLY